MSTFEGLMGSTMQLAAAAERTAAVGAYLRSLDGARVDPAIAETLRAIGESVLPGVSELPEQQRRMLTGALVAFFRQAADLLDDPGRAPGWATNDEVVLQAQGRGSMSIAAVLAAAAANLGDLQSRLDSGGAFCDVGTGVGWLSVAAARRWPNARIVGIDIHDPALALARANLAGEGLTDRIELCRLDVRDLGKDEFDLIWLPGPFLPLAVIEPALAAARGALREGGWVAFGFYGGPDDTDSQAISDLRTIRSGGFRWTAEQVIPALRTAGFSAAQEIPRNWAAPVRLVVARRD